MCPSFPNITVEWWEWRCRKKTGNWRGYQSALSKQCIQLACRSEFAAAADQRQPSPRFHASQSIMQSSGRTPSNRGRAERRSSASQKSSPTVDLRPIKPTSLNQPSVYVIWKNGVSCEESKQHLVELQGPWVTFILDNVYQHHTTQQP